MIDFPDSICEEDRISICRQLDDKDKQIQLLELKFDELDLKFNGGLSYTEAEKLRTSMNQTRYMLDSIYRELKNLNLKVIQYIPENGTVRPFEIKIERIGIVERITNYLKSLMFFEIKLKNE